MENPRDRNDAIERLLREVRATPDDRAVGPCLTPEEVAAWVDGGLSQQEAARVETHAASCAECRELVAAFAKAVPDTHHAVQRPGVGWLMPMAAAAVVVLGVWLTRPGTPRAPTTPAPASQSARLEEPPAADEGPRTQARGGTPQPRSEPPASRPSDAQQAEPAREASRSADAEFKAVAPPGPATQDRLGQSNAVGTTPAAPTESDRAAVPPLARVGAALAARAAAPALTIVSPAGRTRWRVAAPEVLEQSGDGGLSWTALVDVPAGVISSVVGGVSPSDDVCWLVGRGGLVLVTRNRRRFNRIMPPEVVDLVAVEAEDANTAVVRDANGRSWETRDGGRTWLGVP